MKSTAELEKIWLACRFEPDWLWLLWITEEYSDAELAILNDFESTHQQVVVDKLQEEWELWRRENLPKTENEWLEALPGSRRIARKAWKQQIEPAEDQVVKLEEEKRETSRKFTLYNDRIILELIHEYLDKAIERRQKKIRKYSWLLNPVVKTGGITDEDIARAREVPIDNFYEGRLRKVAGKLIGKCPFHEEKTPSFHIYIDQNSFWCYGCNTGGSSIDYVMKLNNCEFLNAVKFLIGK